MSRLKVTSKLIELCCDCLLRPSLSFSSASELGNHLWRDRTRNTIVLASLMHGIANAKDGFMNNNLKRMDVHMGDG